MSRNDNEQITDMLEAADRVAELVADGRDAWERDRTRQLATERLIEIIGASARALTEPGRARYPDLPWRQIVNAQDLLAYQYYCVDRDLVWTIASQDVPELATRLRQPGQLADQSGPSS